jgi:hypothetical protein
MTIKELKEIIKNLPEDLNVVLKIEIYDTKSTWDSQAFAYENHVIEDFSVSADNESIKISPYDTIKVGNN